MLVLTRRVGEEIVIAGEIRITVVSVRGDRVRIGIEAPRSISVERHEVYARRMAQMGDALAPQGAELVESHAQSS
jgi:carbon storage regulator CsrA